jgi:hypothetical protein
MKYLIALVAAAFCMSLGACAHKEPPKSCTDAKCCKK